MKQKRWHIGHCMAQRDPIFDSGLNIFSKSFFPFFQEQPWEGRSNPQKVCLPPCLKDIIFLCLGSFPLLKNYYCHILRATPNKMVVLVGAHNKVEDPRGHQAVVVKLPLFVRGKITIY